MIAQAQEVVALDVHPLVLPRLLQDDRRGARCEFDAGGTLAVAYGGELLAEQRGGGLSRRPGPGCRCRQGERVETGAGGAVGAAVSAIWASRRIIRQVSGKAQPARASPFRQRRSL